MARAAPDGVLVLDGDLRIAYANPAYCGLFGFPRNRLLGQDILPFVPERLRQTALAWWADVRDGRSEPIRGAGLRADGSELEIETTGTVLDLQGQQFLVIAVRPMAQRQQQDGQAATAAANARLLAAAREKDALEERRRLARELYDSVSRSLYAIQLGAQMARERLDRDPAGVAQPIDHITRLAEASQAEMRALIFALRPEALETEGLVTALNRQIEVLRARHRFAGQAVASPEPELPIAAKQALYRIGREALWNAVKHARAGRVDVRLEEDGGSVLLEVADDGVGFDADGSFPGHLGLRFMRERALGAGGLLEIVSACGRGTRVVVRVPPAP